MHRKIALCFAVVAVVAMAATGARAAWSDGFEGYDVGTGVISKGAWVGWEGAAGNDGVVTSDQAHSGDNSLQVGGEAMVDIVPQFSGVTSGVWTFSAWTYIPSGTTGGFDMGGLSRHKNFQGAGNTQWFGHLGFGLGDGTNGTFGSEAVQYDTWVEINSVLDIDAHTFDLYYDGAPSGSGAWGAGLDSALVGLDVWTGAGAGVMYVDDMSLVPEPGTLSLLGVGGICLLLAGLRRRRRTA